MATLIQTEAISQEIVSILSSRGMTLVGFARKLGISKELLRLAIVGKSRPTRRRIEVELGMPIFSTAEAFSKANLLVQRLGADPEVADLNELREIARRFGIKVPTSSVRRRLLTAFTAHFQNHSAKQIPTRRRNP